TVCNHAAGRWWRRLFAAGDAVELLRLGVVGFEGVVGDGPIPKGAREAVPVVLAGVEVVLAGAQEGRAVQGCATAEDAAHVAAGDVTGDGKADIVTGAGAGPGPHVKVFDASGAEVRNFFAYAPAFTGGVTVAAGDLDGDGHAEILTGAGAGAAAGHVKA